TRFLATVIVENSLVPALVLLRSCPREAIIHTNRLQREPPAELPTQIVAGDELAETRMKRRHMVVLEIDLDEALPVVVAVVDFDAIEHMAAEVEFACDGQRGEIGGDVTLAFEQHAIPRLQWRAAQIEAGLRVEVRRTQ